VASANQITLTASEEIAALNGVELDGNPIVPNSMSGDSATFNTGVLSNGTHTLTGTVVDAVGKSTSFSISFVIGVVAPPPAPAPFSAAPPVVPTPADFRGTIEADGTLTLRWSLGSASSRFGYVLFVDGVATQSLAPGSDEIDLGPFDPADLRTFAIGAVDAAGNVSPLTGSLRSTSLLAGKTPEEATAILVNRGFAVGAVRGAGPVVVAPRGALLVPLGSPVDLELGQPEAPQSRLVFTVVGSRQVAVAKTRTVALRVQTTRAARVTAVLLSPRGERIYRWRFDVKAGATIKQLRLPPQVKRPGNYRITFTVTSGSQSVKRTIVVRVLAKATNARVNVPKQPVEIVLAGGSAIRRDIALGLGSTVRLTSAATSDDAWQLAGATNRNVQVIVVDVDRYGLNMVRDLRLVFRNVKILALTNDPRRLAQAVRVGATIAVPRSTPPGDIAKLIVQLARRR
jgi:hypothetical protein